SPLHIRFLYMETGLSTTREYGCPKTNVRRAGLKGSGAGLRGRSDRQNGAPGFTRNLDRGMEKFRERFDAGYETRARPRKVAVGLKGVDALVAHRGHCLPLLGQIHRAIFVARP